MLLPGGIGCLPRLRSRSTSSSRTGGSPLRWSSQGKYSYQPCHRPRRRMLPHKPEIADRDRPPAEDLVVAGRGRRRCRAARDSRRDGPSAPESTPAGPLCSVRWPISKGTRRQRFAGADRHDARIVIGYGGEDRDQFCMGNADGHCGISSSACVVVRQLCHTNHAKPMDG